MCAHEQQRFWEMHDLIFANSRKLEDVDLERYARQIGLSSRRFASCFAAKDHEAAILEDQRTATSLGARGTPAFFINGRFISGAQPKASFERLINVELAKAKASGIPRAAYYRQVVEEKGAKAP